MPAGQRRTRLTFYRPTIDSQNASGEDVVTNVEIGAAWAQMEALTGRELQIAAQRFAEAKFRIVIDNPLASFAPQREDFIQWGTRRLNILDCEDPTQQRRSLVLLASEYTA